MYLISDNVDTLTGMRLAGVDLSLIHIYAASVGDVEADINVAGTLAAQVMERAIVNAIHAV